MHEKSKFVSRRWRTVAVLAAGVAIGAVLFATPAASHIGSVTHLWGKHIKPRADVRYANAVSGTDQAKNSAKLQGRTWGNFLSDVVVVVASSGSISNGGFDTATASCPAGYFAIAGGVDPANVATMEVTSSAPTTTTHPRLYANPDGQQEPTGWHGAVVNNTGSTQNPGFKVGVVCAKA